MNKTQIVARLKEVFLDTGECLEKKPGTRRSEEYPKANTCKVQSDATVTKLICSGWREECREWAGMNFVGCWPLTGNCHYLIVDDVFAAQSTLRAPLDRVRKGLVYEALSAGFKARVHGC